MPIASEKHLGVWRAIGRLEDIPRRGARTVETDRGTIAVFRTGDGDVLAVDDRCPHRDGPLSEGIVTGRRVTCPLHGLKLSLESGKAISPDTGCVRSHPVRVSDGMIYLDLSRRGGRR